MKVQITAICIFLTCFVFVDRLNAQDFTPTGAMKLNGIAKDTKYGYTEKKPIKVGSIANQRKFLAALRSPKGEKVTYHRLGSCCPFKTKNGIVDNTGLLDKYEIIYVGIQEPAIIYLNGYDYKKPQCPQGFTYAED